MNDEARAATAPCPDCGSEVAPTMLVCPACRRLVHGGRLRQLAEEAAAAKEADDLTGELAAWRSALELLPPNARQAAVIRSRLEVLSRRVDGSPGAGAGLWKKGVAGAGGLALLLWKFKSIAAFVVTKGKAIVLGATSLGTFAGVLASFGVYWAVWGWKFAAGLVVSLYIHEMGHVVALRRFGIAASAPAFIPGLGAFVRLRQYPANAIEDARVGLAGPIWGTAAALGSYAIYIIAGLPELGAIARFGAWINLFNLIPLGPLDGGRAFRALDRRQRLLAAGVLGAMWFFTAEGLLCIVLIVALLRGFATTDATGDRRTLLQYSVLIIVLAALCAIHVPTGG